MTLTKCGAQMFLNLELISITGTPERMDSKIELGCLRPTSFRNLYFIRRRSTPQVSMSVNVKTYQNTCHYRIINLKCVNIKSIS